MDRNMTTPGYVQPNAYGPVTPTQMFERTMTLLRENFKLFFGIVLVAVGVEVVVGTVISGSGIWLRHSVGAAPVARALILLPLSLLGAALIYIFTQIILGALFFATQSKLADAPMTVGEACRLATEKTGKLVGIALLVALRIFGYVLLFYAFIGIPLLVITLIPGIFRHSSLQLVHAPSLWFMIFFIVFLLAFLIAYFGALLWLVARYALSIPAGLAENLSIKDAIRRSIHLSAGSRGRIYAVFLVVIGFSIGIAAVTLPIQIMVAHKALIHRTISPEAVSIAARCISVIADLLSGVLVAFMGVAITLCYFDLRVRKEGFGVVLPPPASEPDPIILSPAPEPQSPGMPTEDFPAS